jgi:hypothetical protein
VKLEAIIVNSIVECLLSSRIMILSGLSTDKPPVVERKERDGLWVYYLGLFPFCL